MTPRTQLVVAMLASFLFGISGGAIAGFAVSTFMQHGRGGGDGLRRHEMRVIYRRPMARDLERGLDLTPQQRERFDAILRESGTRYAAVRESTRAALERELTPEQREKFRRMEHRFVRHRRMDGRFPPWPNRRPQWESDSIEGDQR